MECVQKAGRNRDGRLAIVEGHLGYFTEEDCELYSVEANEELQS
jgi:hypothetical protein